MLLQVCKLPKWTEIKALVLFLCGVSTQLFRITVGSEHKGLGIHPHLICRGMRRVENTSIWKIKLSAWNKCSNNNNIADGPLRLNSQGPF